VVTGTGVEKEVVLTGEGVLKRFFLYGMGLSMGVFGNGVVVRTGVWLLRLGEPKRESDNLSKARISGVRLVSS